MSGKIDILNCGAGHSEVKIDVSDPIALARSERIIQDMLRRGYVLFITGPDNALVRVERFDPTKHVYIIGEGPLYAGESNPAAEVPREYPSAAEPVKRGPGRPKKTTREVPIGEAHVTAIARTAGG